VNSKIEKICAQKRNESNNSPINVGVVSCFNYQSETNIKKLFICLKGFKENFKILGGGNVYGCDQYISRLSINSGYDFVEYTPKHFNHTIYSYFPKNFHTSKYDVDNMNIRYNYLYFDCDILFIFHNKNKRDVFILKLIEHASESSSEKDVVLID
jgi:hypothetical protein